MKPFNLTFAKRGDPLISREGTRVKFITHIPDAGKYYQVVFLCGDLVYTCSVDGEWGNGGLDSRDIFMAPKKRTVWVNLHSYATAQYYSCKESADNWAGDRIGNKAWPLEIEE